MNTGPDPVGLKSTDLDPDPRPWLFRSITSSSIFASVAITCSVIRNLPTFRLLMHAFCLVRSCTRNLDLRNKDIETCSPRWPLHQNWREARSDMAKRTSSEWWVQFGLGSWKEGRRYQTLNRIKMSSKFIPYHGPKIRQNPDFFFFSLSSTFFLSIIQKYSLDFHEVCQLYIWFKEKIGLWWFFWTILKLTNWMNIDEILIRHRYLQLMDSLSLFQLKSIPIVKKTFRRFCQRHSI